MAFPDDLLRDAYHLAARGGKNPTQSTLRRAVSTAYYALFHLLVADFVLNWRTKDQRARLGRMFEHRKMSQAAFRFQAGKPNPVEVDVKRVIDDVTNTLAVADEAFKAWKAIRKEKIAQDHLLTMFGARRV